MIPRLGLILLLALSVGAGFLHLPAVSPPTITLAWDPVPGVTGYKVYQGAISRGYTNSISVGNVTNATVPLPPGTNYFAVTAVGTNGVESDYSNEAVYAPPAPIPTYGLLFNQGSTDMVNWVDLTPQPFLRLTNGSGGPLPWQFFRSRVQITTNWQ